jgi:hypothetical protein
MQNGFGKGRKGRGMKGRGMGEKNMSWNYSSDNHSSDNFLFSRHLRYFLLFRQRIFDIMEACSLK